MGDEQKNENRTQNEALEPLIYSIRNQRRFPEDFAFRLTPTEFGVLKASRVPDNRQGIDSKSNSVNWSQFATSSSRHRGAAYRPWAFTEHGALMAANIVRTEWAERMSVYVIRAFVRLRERVAANAVVLQRLAEIDSTLLQHDAALRDVYRKLRPLLQAPPDPPRRRIGFHTDSD